MSKERKNSGVCFPKRKSKPNPVQAEQKANEYLRAIRIQRENRSKTDPKRGTRLPSVTIDKANSKKQPKFKQPILPRSTISRPRAQAELAKIKTIRRLKRQVTNIKSSLGPCSCNQQTKLKDTNNRTVENPITGGGGKCCECKNCRCGCVQVTTSDGGGADKVKRKNPVAAVSGKATKSRTVDRLKLHRKGTPLVNITLKVCSCSAKSTSSEVSAAAQSEKSTNNVYTCASNRARELMMRSKQNEKTITPSAAKRSFSNDSLHLGFAVSESDGLTSLKLTSDNGGSKSSCDKSAVITDDKLLSDRTTELRIKEQTTKETLEKRDQQENYKDDDYDDGTKKYAKKKVLGNSSSPSSRSSSSSSDWELLSGVSLGVNDDKTNSINYCIKRRSISSDNEAFEGMRCELHLPEVRRSVHSEEEFQQSDDVICRYLDCKPCASVGGSGGGRGSFSVSTVSTADPFEEMKCMKHHYQQQPSKEMLKTYNIEEQGAYEMSDYYNCDSLG